MYFSRIILICILLSDVTLCAPASFFLPNWSQNGWENGHWRIRTSLHTIHYHPTSAHNNQQHLLNIEYVRADNWSIGIAAFSNSFAQPTQYAYVGHDWSLWANDDWQVRASLTGGLLHGYKGEYKDKIPLNDFGVAPALLPIIGVTYQQSWFLEAQFFATAGVMATIGYRF